MPAPRTAGHDTDVVVVGAGPVGLLLALELRLHGVRVTVLEQLAAPTTESRASTLHTRTMELLEELDLLAGLAPQPGPRGHFGGIPLDLAAADPAHRFAGQWKVPQTRVEAVLQQHAVQRGADLRRGHRVTGLAQHPGQVEVEAAGPGGRPLVLRCAYAVGCDGEQSTVRDLAGFGMTGDGATKELLRADVEGIDIPDRRFERLQNGLAIASRWPSGATRVMVHVYGSAPRERPGPPDFAEVVAAWRQVTGEDIGHGRPVWLNAFGNSRLQAERYRNGRVLLAGDAAHVQMPVGGQAVNFGLHDAAALGRALAAQFGGSPDPAALDSYHAVRHPVGRRVLTAIEAQAQLLLGGPEMEPLRTVFAELMALEAVPRHLAATISGLDAPHPHHPADPGPAPAPPPAVSFIPATRSVPDRRASMPQLSGKTALVTGSTRGIGRAVALRLARAGALVAVHGSSSQEAADEVVRQVEQDGGRAFALQAELGVPGDVHELFLALERGLKERTGGTDLDILVNNAGVMGGTPPQDVTPEQFDRLYAVNAKAPFFLVQRALGNMPDGGRIVNISSGLTRFANPQEVAYAMTKGAIDQLTLHFAKHLAPRGITVNSVGPGITNNGSPVFGIPEAVEQMAAMSAFNRVGEPDDVASVVAFLASDDARWITGSYLDASGGTLLGG
ncbi:SDR family oxidoreductase [Actinacidiphila bryophytorum]|uniref:SDR family oxidoreductase n=1 Tax=Actinacidiphila bryophytorum TaxID=1436133 RepID=UPI002176DAD7|nr:SDR family oxidoreductase [Actinacidiphila bryophytorum]UWE09965.1 SDR family oxidoreductase [Actinacidiphila bryophytorum]